jgi:glycosyltransferase involved in cell wall biosynthesis
MKGDEALSIVICTHNRSGMLATALESLVCQVAPLENYEILVVDNHSTDETKRVVERFATKLKNLCYVYESEIGLSAARNRGWQEAHGRYVGYLDDDAKVPLEWVSVALEVIDRIAPEAFGGPYFAFYNSPKPAWFKDEYATYVKGNESRRLNEEEYLSGCNLFIRRDVLDELNGFNTALGMTGKKIAYGEETSFLKILREKYPCAYIYYEPRLFIYHLVRDEKMDLWRWPKRFLIDGRYSYRAQSPVNGTGVRDTILEIALILLRLFKSCTWDLVRRDREKYPHFQSFLYEHSMPYFQRLGWNLEVLSRALKGD